TGKMFGIEHFGVEPDLITVAKSMAAGVPISGVLGRAAIVDRAGDSTIGGTFVGSPLGCVAGVAVLDEIAERDLLGRGVSIGERMRARFLELQMRYVHIGDVRGLGPMVALEFVRDGSTKEPAPDLATAVAEAAFRRGLLILKAGIHGNCLRVLVSLVAGDEQIEESLDVFEAALEDVLAPAAAAAGAAR
ncbi:MAG: 4-aminobutyrate aminotransferase / (S)-3-amino-2-methylpropionate transaminase / 5-aminovalerate, partial [Gaiellales bacterium]|nr:4-aminobutyrate aminotransferase / (S)-3-amino-2-methylpropionate transaminase / 5-aminovalerate [Gaiellales bacterium]